MAPITDGMVGAKQQVLGFAGLRQFLQDVPFERRAHHIIVGQSGVPDTETVVVFGRNHEVAGTGRFGGGDPARRIEVHRIELLIQLVVFLFGHFIAAGPADLGTFEADGSPVNEQAETHRLPPLERRPAEALRRWVAEPPGWRRRCGHPLAACPLSPAVDP